MTEIPSIIATISSIGNYVLMLVANFVFYKTIEIFIPVRQYKLVKIAAFLFLLFVSGTVIYENDIVNSTLVLLVFLICMFLFYDGRWPHKLSAVLIFYPLIISTSFIAEHIGAKIFFSFEQQKPIYDSLLHIGLYFVRLLFLCFVYLFCKKNVPDILKFVNKKGWLLIGGISCSVFLSTYLIILFLPEEGSVDLFQGIVFIDNIYWIAYIICAANIATLFVCLYLTGYLSRSIENSFKLKMMQAEHNYYEEKLQEEQIVRGIYHDMKNHLLLLQAQSNEEEISIMVKELQQKISGYEDYVKTGNSFLDIILRDKAKKAKGVNIDFSVILHMEESGFIEPLDISTIFGNAIDNAIEACSNVPLNERFITVKGSRVRDMLSILVENSSVEEAIPAKGKTSKKDAFFHGFGLSNIKKSVEKYNGECSAYIEDNCFKLKILMPIPNEFLNKDSQIKAFK